MTPAYVVAVVASIVFLIFCYLFDLFLFFIHLQKRFLNFGSEKTFLRELERDHKKKKHPAKKNLLLFFIVQSLTEQGEEEKADKLSCFLKNDFLFGIKKRSDR